MKNLRLLTYLLLSPFILASCVNDSLDEATLSLSEQGIVQLPKSASEKVIAITTNQTEWNAIDNAEWMEVSQEGSNLTIKATENPTTEIRRAEVIIVAGGTNKKIQVEQAASDATIVTIPDKLNINQWEGTYQFEVEANTTNWQAVTDVDWLTVETDPLKGIIKVIAKENFVREERTAKVIVAGKDNKGAKEIIVVQSGTMYFILPYEKGNVPANEVANFELNRRSVKLSSMLYESYGTQSPIIPKIDYSLTNGKVSSATVTFTSEELLTTEEFFKFMKDNTYEYYEDFGLFYSKEKKIGAMPLGKNLMFIYNAVQDKTYPTFASFPWGLSKTIGSDDTESVKKYETEHNGVFDETSTPTSLWFDVKEKPYVVRLYSMNSATPAVTKQVLHVYDNVSLALFDYAGTYAITDEFMALAEKEGFVDYGYDYDLKQFSLYNEKEKVQIVMKVAQFSDLAYGASVLLMYYLKRDTPIVYNLSFTSRMDKNAITKYRSIHSDNILKLKR